MQPYPPYHPFPCQSKVAIPFDSADSLSPTRSLHELFSSRITWRTCIEPLPLSPTRSETVCEPCGFLPHLAAEGRRHSTRRSEEAAGLRVAETSRETSVSCRQDIISVSVVSTRF